MTVVCTRKRHHNKLPPPAPAPQPPLSPSPPPSHLPCAHPPLHCQRSRTSGFPARIVCEHLVELPYGQGSIRGAGPSSFHSSLSCCHLLFVNLRRPSPLPPSPLNTPFLRSFLLHSFRPRSLHYFPLFSRPLAAPASLPPSWSSFNPCTFCSSIVKPYSYKNSGNPPNACPWA